MLRHLSEFTIRVFDLIEAEGRALRVVIAKMGLGLVLTVVACVMLLVGSGLVLHGVWLGIAQTSLGPAWASAITGFLMLGLAAGAFAVVVRLSK